MTVPRCTCGLPSADWTHVTWSADRPADAHRYQPAHAHPNPSPRTHATIADPDKYRALRARIAAQVNATSA